MSSRFDLIVQQLLQKPFSDCSSQELRQLTDKYPYLAPAQFLLAKKLQLEGDAAAQAQMQKAALYYHQPAAFGAYLNFEDRDTDLLVADEQADGETEDEDLPIFNIPSLETARANIPVAEAFAPEPPVSTEAKEQDPIGTVRPSADPAPDAPSFEPYHTIDYFASQGIKLSAEEATKDNFGKQLKSFTQWLKSMKKIPASEQIKSLDPLSERKVERMAAHSVEDTEIVTEAMAEVWIKQGSWEKAAAVYHKLSLLNPSKKAYFAAKLESLKKKI